MVGCGSVRGPRAQIPWVVDDRAAPAGFAAYIGCGFGRASGPIGKFRQAGLASSHARGPGGMTVLARAAKAGPAGWRPAAGKGGQMTTRDGVACDRGPWEVSGADPLTVRGATVWPGCLDAASQAALMRDVQAIWAAAPPRHPLTRWGRPLSVGMSAAGALGWTSDRRGYRYVPAQDDGRPWPPIPPALLALWARLLPQARPPDSCLVNLYRGAARMGLHQDRDEADLTQPVLSVSLGDEALFRLGGVARGGRTESLWLRSGDVLALSGDARLIHHGIDRIRPGSSDLVPGGGRVNLTLRVAGA